MKLTEANLGDLLFVRPYKCPRTKTFREKIVAFTCLDPFESVFLKLNESVVLLEFRDDNSSDVWVLSSKGRCSMSRNNLSRDPT